MSEARTFKLDELASAAGVSPRTVRYYVQRGLLPAPAFRGRDTVYDEEHFLRLRAIRRMQEQFLPLDAIQSALAGLDRAGLERAAEGPFVPRVPAPEPHRTPIGPPWRAPDPPRPSGVRVTRWELAPGLVVELSDDASPQVRAWAEEIVRRRQP